MTCAHRLGFACSALAALVCGACDGGSMAELSPRRRVLESLGHEVILPLLADFARDAEALEVATARLCDAKDADALAAAQAAWSTAHGRFKQTEVLAFGPHTLSPWRLGAKLDFWPARQDAILEQLAAQPAGPDDADGGTDTTAESAATTLGAAARGLPAIEYLLYADGDAAVLAALRAEADRGAGPRCAYLRALGGALVSDARALRAAWRDGFLDAFTLARGPNEHFASIQESFGTLINSVAFTAEAVRDQKLGVPLGSKTAATPAPEQTESRFAGRSIDDALDALAGIEHLFYGRYGRRESRGLDDLLGERGPMLVATFELRMQRARDALRAIPAPLSRAVEREPAAVQDALDELEALAVYLRVTLTQELAVTVTFGGNDGD